jgi:protein KRI1
VGGIKTRFKYTKSAPVSYGLTPAEILMATDEELNALISVKHYAPYRRGGLGLQGRGFGRRLRDLKDRVGSRKWGDDMPAESRRRACSFPGGANTIALGVRSEPKKRAGKKERQRKAAEAADAGEEQAETAGLLAAVAGKRKREEQEPPVEAAAAAAAPADGEGKKKRRKKKKTAEA